MWIRIGLSLALLLMSAAAVIWKLRNDRGGPQEWRVRNGFIRVPKVIGKPPRPPLGFWFWPLLAIVGVIVCFFFLSVIQKGYYAVVLLDRGKTITATVYQSGLPTNDSWYQFEVDGKRYTGRGPSHKNEADQLEVAYDPDSPEVNRPSDGLLFDAIVAVGLVGFLVVGLTLNLIPKRKPTPYEEMQVAPILAKLKEADFRGAVEALRESGLPNQNAEMLNLADGIVAVCCDRADPAIYEDGLDTLAAMQGLTEDAHTRRELAFFYQELDLSARMWDQHLSAGDK